MNKSTPYTVRFGPASAVFERPGSSSAIVAVVLGSRHNDGMETVYLDRLIHDAATEVEGWRCGGAETTMLSRSQPASEEASRPGAARPADGA